MDKHNWYYRFLADTDWLNDHHSDIDNSFWNMMLEITESTGVVYGLDVSERAAGANFSIDVSSGVAYDTYGRRIVNNSTTNVEFDVDADENTIEVTTSGNERVVSVYAYYNTSDSDPAVDGFGNTVYQITTEDVEFVLYQGTEALLGTATAPTNPGDGGVLLANVTIYYSDATVDDSEIDTSVKEELTILGFSSFVHDEGDEDIDGNWSFHNGSTITFYSDEGVTQVFQIDGATGDITMTGNISIDGTVDGVDLSDHDHSGTGQGGTVDHENLSSIGTYNHSEIDTHIDDATLHFTESSIDHGSISGLGDDDHPQYAEIANTESISGAWSFTTPPSSITPTAGAHLATKDYVDTTILTDHGSLSGLSDDDHPQYAGISQSETINGSWSFSTIPSCSVTPTSSNHLVNKSYVDSLSLTDHGTLSGLSGDDHPQYLHLNKSSQTLQQDLNVAGGVEIDGVNISNHTHDDSFSFTLGYSGTMYQRHVNSSNLDNTYSISGSSSDFLTFALCQIDLHNNNFSSDNQVRVGGTSYTTVGGFDAINYPTYSSGSWNYRVYANAGNDDQVTCHWVALLDVTKSVNITTDGPN